MRDLDDRIKLANGKIRAIIAQNPELEGMGTTMTALFLAGGSHLAFAHIGDSRAYRLRGGVLEQISTDHTWVQRLIDEGQITPEEAERHPQRSLLMRALGTTSEVDLDLTVLDLQAGDRYLLCSDGLSGFVPFNTLASTLAGYGDPHHAAETLIQHALRGGGADNITCIVADAYEQLAPGLAARRARPRRSTSSCRSSSAPPRRTRRTGCPPTPRSPASPARTRRIPASPG